MVQYTIIRTNLRTHTETSKNTRSLMQKTKYPQAPTRIDENAHKLTHI